MFRTSITLSLAIAFVLIIAVPCTALAETEATSSDATATDKRLTDILSNQSADAKSRYPWRRPAETMSFCQIQEGDTIIETFPGGGWYSRILYPYLGKNGRLIGAQYPLSVFKRFGWDDARLQPILNRDKNWARSIARDPVAIGGAIDVYTMTQMPKRYYGIADKVLFIRSLHNLNRFGDETGYMKNTLNESFLSLKPGGIACVVQHRASETASDVWANGSNGYLKQSVVITAFEAAGFKLVETSEMNANPKDRPSENESVWRLPPTMRGSKENTAQWRAMKEIGESSRMTLRFIKPPM